MAINLFTGAINANTGTAGNWSLGTVPTSSDGHVATFDATSPNYTVNVALSCNAIDWTGYTNTGTHSATITSSGNMTFGSGMNIIGASALSMIVSATLTTNGYQWPNNFTFAGVTQTYILADAASFGGNFTANNSPTFTLNGDLTILGSFTGGGSPTINGAYTVYLAGDYAHPNGNVSGTASWVWNGTTDKTWTASISQSIGFNSNLTINGTGLLTFTGGRVMRIGGNTFKILSNVVTSDCDLNVLTTTTATIIDAPLSFGAIWKSFTSTNLGVYTVQLDSPLYTYNTAAIGSGSQNFNLNGSPLYIVDGTLTSGAGSAGAILGTSQIYMIGNKAAYLLGLSYKIQLHHYR